MERVSENAGTELLNSKPTSTILLGKSAYSNPRSLQPERKLASVNIYLQWRDIRIGEHLNKLDMQKSKEPVRIHVQVLREGQLECETFLNYL